MDDFLVLGYDKRELREIKKQLQEFLREKLKLELHPKKANIFPVDKSVDFLGYRIFGNYRLLRKSTVRRFVKRTRIYRKRLNKNLMNKEKFNNSLQSWNAYAEFGNTWRLRRDLEERLKIRFSAAPSNPAEIWDLTRRRGAVPLGCIWRIKNF